MERIAAYVRVSTAEQAESGLSIEAQGSALERYAAAAGAELELFTDAGASGAKRVGRPALAAMLADARRFDAVVVTRLDRLSRSTADSLAIAAELEAAGVALVDLSCPMSATGAIGSFTYTLRAAAAKLERDLIAERTAAAMQAKRERGEWTGGRPALGLRQNGTTLEADPERIGTARAIYDLRERGLSLRAIAAALNTSGVPTARGGRWAAATVLRILNNSNLAAALVAA